MDINFKDLPPGTIVFVIPDKTSSIPVADTSSINEVQPVELNTKEEKPEPECPAPNVRNLEQDGTFYFAVYDLINELGYVEQTGKQVHNIWTQILKLYPHLQGRVVRHLFTVGRTGKPLSARQTTPCIPYEEADVVKQALIELFTVEPEELPAKENLVSFPTKFTYGSETFNSAQDVARRAKDILRGPEGDLKGKDLAFIKDLFMSKEMGRRTVITYGEINAVKLLWHKDKTSKHFVIFLGPNNKAQTIKLYNYLPENWQDSPTPVQLTPIKKPQLAENFF